jgi:glycosyltransferase involved in cell wall biosynthesis
MAKNVACGIARAMPSDTTLQITSAQQWDMGTHGGTVRWKQVGSAWNRFVGETWQAYRDWNTTDAMLYPNYFTPPGVNQSATRIVTVIHDLQYLHFPHNFSWRKRQWLRWSHAATLRSADVVIAISDFVRDDILSRYGARWEGKVRTIPNPICWSRFDADGALDPGIRGWEWLSEARYILSVAAHYPHKNLLSLVRAFADLRRQPKFGDVRLILVGQHAKNLVSTSDGAALDAEVHRLGLDGGVVVTGYITDAEIGLLLRHATLFAFPSLFEGFGMPPVEALGMGLPVLVSRRASLPESTLGMAHYIDHPEDVRELREWMAEILDSPDRYRPPASRVEQIREHYDVKRIGRLYYSALAG